MAPAEPLGQYSGDRPGAIRLDDVFRDPSHPDPSHPDPSHPDPSHPEASHPEAISVSALYDAIEEAIRGSFPPSRPIWVQGEIHSLSVHTRSGHCYIDLVDPEAGSDNRAPVLKVKCWNRNWARIRAELDRQGLVLEVGSVVAMRGHVDLYKPRGELGFIVEEVDVAGLLGRLAMKRAALIAALEREGLLELNARAPLPLVPLRVGLVASPGTEGYKDFLGQLRASGFGFEVLVSPAQVQGEDAPLSIVGALHALKEADCDVVVVVRGGGSRGDLAAFDAEVVARTIATMPCQVWTGIGHTGDESVADLVAARRFVTPTECGRKLAELVREFYDAVIWRVKLVAGRAEAALAEAEEHETSARERVVAMARHGVAAAEARVSSSAALVGAGARRALLVAEQAVASRSSRIGPMVLAHLGHLEQRIESWSRLIAAYDVERQLERGYTLTLDEGGAIIRSAEVALAARVLVTRFASGRVTSVVDSGG